MSIIKTHKVRLVTNNAEATLLARHQGYARFAFNHALADFREGLDAGEWRGEKTLRPRFNAVKRTLAPWSASLSQNASKYAIVELGQAIEAFGTYRKAVRAGKKANPVGFPRFRKRSSASGFRADNGPGTVRLEGKSIRLPKVGTLRTRESLRFDGDVVEVTVKREAGRWFACVAVRMTETPPLPRPDEVPDEAIGVDVGIKTLAVCSDGTVYENPKALGKSLSRLRRLDKSIARSRNAHGRNQHSNRRERKYRLRETVHARVRNIRNDAHHKAASAITAKPVGKVVVETLNVSGMMKNRRLSRALADASLAGFIAKLEYRCGWLGLAFEKVDRWFPSTRTCSECGAVRPNMDLSERTFACHSCGVMIDRDLNAALNLRNAESYPASGRGAEISPAISGCQATAVKCQETAVRDNQRLSLIGIGSQ